MRAITLTPKDGICLVNGKSVEKQTTLQHNDRLILGLSQVFHVFDPQVAMGDGSLGAKVIDWDMAQEEVAAGLNAMVHQRRSCSRAAFVEPHKPRAHDTGQQKGRGRDEADPKRVDAAASAREGEAEQGNEEGAALHPRLARAARPCANPSEMLSSLLQMEQLETQLKSIDKKGDKSEEVKRAVERAQKVLRSRSEWSWEGTASFRTRQSVS